MGVCVRHAVVSLVRRFSAISIKSDCGWLLLDLIKGMASRKGWSQREKHIRSLETEESRQSSPAP